MFTKNLTSINLQHWVKLNNMLKKYCIIQSYYPVSNKNDESEAMCLINKLSLIPNKNLLVSHAKIMKSSKGEK